MKVVLFFFITSFLGASTSDGVLYFSPDQIEKAFSSGHPLTSAANYKVLFSMREKPGEVEIHKVDTDLIYIISGTAEFVIGGESRGAIEKEKDEWRGGTLDGGQTQNLRGGEFFVIPNGVPHWFKSIRKTVKYSVVKVK
jgi:mannose-6-phosphate isomerase-like protein (cupin superfamily)